MDKSFDLVEVVEMKALKIQYELTAQKSLEKGLMARHSIGTSLLFKMAQSPADKQAACNCAKDAASRVPNIKEDAAASLPAKCNIQVNFPISKNTNCQDIH
ncbi:Plant lipid transfer protein/Par allergen [Corchorus olitorius]|uniref:Plant lipid transfer protein/Par allergen n=1 Tax=Corchorus olitorius TaxID=93759 RepID=A0A1R3GHN2_9ROSI|nr:Plant lipid transfer protein/Par allergen [Corchorus olitorius]